MKKSLLTMTAAVALVGAMGAGATLAYFSDSTGNVTNTFTFVEDGIDIDLFEYSNGSNNETVGTWVKKNSYTDIVPGMTVEKEPFVIVSDDSADCLVYVEVYNPNGENIAINYNDTDEDGNTIWEVVKTEGDYTYLKYAEEVELATDATTEYNGDNVHQLPSVFTEITFATTLSKEDTLSDIVVQAAAVQADHRTDDATTAALNLLKLK